jgi:hypothetical protein
MPSIRVVPKNDPSRVPLPTAERRLRPLLFEAQEAREVAVLEVRDDLGLGSDVSAVMMVSSPAFRSMALGIMFSVLFVLAATLSLLPAVLSKLGPRVDELSPQATRPGERSGVSGGHPSAPRGRETVMPEKRTAFPAVSMVSSTACGTSSCPPKSAPRKRMTTKKRVVDTDSTLDAALIG